MDAGSAFSQALNWASNTLGGAVKDIGSFFAPQQAPQPAQPQQPAPTAPASQPAQPDPWSMQGLAGAFQNFQQLPQQLYQPINQFANQNVIQPLEHQVGQFAQGFANPQNAGEDNESMARMTGEFFGGDARGMSGIIGPTEEAAGKGYSLAKGAIGAGIGAGTNLLSSAINNQPIDPGSLALNTGMGALMGLGGRDLSTGAKMAADDITDLGRETLDNAQAQPGGLQAGFAKIPGASDDMAKLQAQVNQIQGTMSEKVAQADAGKISEVEQFPSTAYRMPNGTKMTPDAAKYTQELIPQITQGRDVLANDPQALQKSLAQYNNSDDFIKSFELNHTPADRKDMLNTAHGEVTLVDPSTITTNGVKDRNVIHAHAVDQMVSNNGLPSPIVLRRIYGKDGTISYDIIDGHHRGIQAQAYKYKQIPAVVVDDRMPTTIAQSFDNARQGTFKQGAVSAGKPFSVRENTKEFKTALANVEAVNPTKGKLNKTATQMGQYSIYRKDLAGKLKPDDALIQAGLDSGYGKYLDNGEKTLENLDKNERALITKYTNAYSNHPIIQERYNNYLAEKGTKTLSPKVISDAQATLSKSQENLPALKSKVAKLGQQSGAVGIQAKVKNAESFIPKVADKGRTVENIPDRNQTTLVYKNKASAETGTNTVVKNAKGLGLKVDKVKRNVSNPETGYHAEGHIQATDKQTGEKVEIQTNTPEGVQSREANHAIYKGDEAQIGKVAGEMSSKVTPEQLSTTAQRGGQQLDHPSINPETRRQLLAAGWSEEEINKITPEQMTGAGGQTSEISSRIPQRQGTFLDAAKNQEAAKYKQYWGTQKPAPDGNIYSAEGKALPFGQEAPIQPGGTRRQRGFLKTVIETPGQKKEVTQAAKEINPQDYEQQTNIRSFATAQDRINAGENAAHQFVLDTKTPWTAEKAGTGELLMQRYAENVKDGNNAKLFDEITDSIDRQARQAGQGNQILSGWSKLSPRAVQNVANQAAKDAGTVLSEDFQKDIVQRSALIRKMAEGSPERIQATQDLLKDIAKAIPPTFWDKFKSFRFQNMLSSPITLAKIAYGAGFNGFITHPLDMFAEAATEKLAGAADRQGLKGLGTYYTTLTRGLPTAFKDAFTGFRTNGVDQAFDEGRQGATTIQMLRQANMPMKYSFFPRLHSFLYTLGKNAIGEAEKARLMDRGVSEADATAQAKALADKLTLRSRLGGKEYQTKAVQAVDGLGRMVQMSAGNKATGWAQSWVAPFMKVSTNWTKLAIEHSPLSLTAAKGAFIDKNPEAMKAFSHAAVGTVASMAGLTLAMQGKVTLAAPTDKTQNEAFFASGRKPYSVLLGNAWVPMQYFGPLGISLMLPEAMRQAMGDTNAGKPPDQKVLAAVINTTKMVAATTPLQTVSQFLDMLNGSASVNLSTMESGFAGQVIPLDAMQRYVAQAIDPVYRKATSFGQRMDTGLLYDPLTTGILPSKTLPAYQTPMGLNETRNITNNIAPYAMGKVNPQYEQEYQTRQAKLNQNAEIANETKNNQTMLSGRVSGTGEATQVASNIAKFQDGTYKYTLADGTVKTAKSQEAAQEDIDSNNFTNGNKTYDFQHGVAYIRDDAGTITKVKAADLTPSANHSTTTDLAQDEKAAKQAKTLIGASGAFNAKSGLTLQGAGKMISDAGGDPNAAYWSNVAGFPEAQRAPYVANYLKDPKNGDLATNLGALINAKVVTSTVAGEMARQKLISPAEAESIRKFITAFNQTTGVTAPASGYGGSSSSSNMLNSYLMKRSLAMGMMNASVPTVQRNVQGTQGAQALSNQLKAGVGGGGKGLSMRFTAGKAVPTASALFGGGKGGDGEGPKLIPIRTAIKSKLPTNIKGLGAGL